MKKGKKEKERKKKKPTQQQKDPTTLPHPQRNLKKQTK